MAVAPSPPQQHGRTIAKSVNVMANYDYCTVCGSSVNVMQDVLIAMENRRHVELLMYVYMFVAL